MVRIAIVEDEMTYAQQLQDYLLEFAKQSGEIIEVVHFSDGAEIAENYKPSFDIILLDVEMKYMDGMTTAEEIRKTDPEVVIIFITNMAHYAIRGYAVDAMDYVLKPVTYFAFSQRLERALMRMKKRSEKFITLSIRGGTQKIDICKICYIESQGHNLVFSTTQGEFTATGTMKSLEEQLQEYNFARCNKGYLINLEHVNKVQDGDVIVNETAIPISRTRKQEFLKALTNYMGEISK